MEPIDDKVTADLKTDLDNDTIEFWINVKTSDTPVLLFF